MKNSAIKHDEIYQYDPLTENQKKAFDAWADGDHLALVGTAGTGKTFLAMYLALELITDKDLQEKIVIFRSVVPTRDMGYLPGSVE